MENSPSLTRIVITGVDIPFGALVRLLLKLALAAIPVYLILMAIAFFAVGVLATLTGAAHWGGFGG